MYPTRMYYNYYYGKMVPFNKTRKIPLKIKFTIGELKKLDEKGMLHTFNDKHYITPGPITGEISKNEEFYALLINKPLPSKSVIYSSTLRCMDDTYKTSNIIRFLKKISPVLNKSETYNNYFFKALQIIMSHEYYEATVINDYFSYLNIISKQVYYPYRIFESSPFNGIIDAHPMMNYFKCYFAFQTFNFDQLQHVVNPRLEAFIMDNRLQFKDYFDLIIFYYFLIVQGKISDALAVLKMFQSSHDNSSNIFLSRAEKLAHYLRGDYKNYLGIRPLHDLPDVPFDFFPELFQTEAYEKTDNWMKKPNDLLSGLNSYMANQIEAKILIERGFYEKALMLKLETMDWEFNTLVLGWQIGLIHYLMGSLLKTISAMHYLVKSQNFQKHTSVKQKSIMLGFYYHMEERVSKNLIQKEHYVIGFILDKPDQTKKNIAPDEELANEWKNRFDSCNEYQLEKLLIELASDVYIHLS